MNLIQVCLDGKWIQAELIEVLQRGVIAQFGEERMLFRNGDWALLW